MHDPKIVFKKCPRWYINILQGPPNNFFLENAYKKTTEYFLKFPFLFEEGRIVLFQLIMEINFIQITALAGNAVAYTIG